MQSVGNFLERLGPVFAFVFFALLITMGVGLVVMSSFYLLRRSYAK